MEFSEIERLSTGSYTGCESNSSTLELLSNFLTYDVGRINEGEHISFIDFLDDPSIWKVEGNMCYFIKKDQKVIMGYNNGLDDESILVLTKEQLRSILTRWAELMKKRPKKILVMRDGDKITLEAKDE